MERLGTGIGWRPEIAEAVERIPVPSRSIPGPLLP